MFKDKKNYAFSKVSQYIISLGCVASLLTIYQISKETINIENNTFSKILEATYLKKKKKLSYQKYPKLKIMKIVTRKI